MNLLSVPFSDFALQCDQERRKRKSLVGMKERNGERELVETPVGSLLRFGIMETVGIYRSRFQSFEGK